jgi:hypothetical protein
LTEVPKLPRALEAIADIVLAHKPKPKTKAAKKSKEGEEKIIGELTAICQFSGQP